MSIAKAKAFLDLARLELDETPEIKGVPVTETIVSPFPVTTAALTDRAVYTKPAFPTSWPVNTVMVDPTFGSRILRVTGPSTLPSSVNASFGTPSAGYQLAWSQDSTKFYVAGSSGGIVPFTFDNGSMTCARINGPGDGGLQISTVSTEPQFSYVNSNIIYVTGQNGTHNTPTIRKFNFATQTYTDLIDLWTVITGVGKTLITSSYCPNIFSSDATPEKIVCLCPTVTGDDNNYVIVFEVNNPANCHVLDTIWEEVSVNGGAFAPTNIPLGIHLHGVDIDRTGRYVLLFTSSGDLAGHAKKYVWDLQTNLFEALTVYPSAHTTLGWGKLINQDFNPVVPYDNAQWSIRNLNDIANPTNLIKDPQAQGETYIDGHTSWHNAVSGTLKPVVGELYRAQDGFNDIPHNDAPWRAWDDEIISIQTDGVGSTTTVWRHCHHHSIVRDDVDTNGSQPFYYQPRVNISPDGRWCLFTSNGDRTLGTQLGSSAPVTKRYDVFLVELRTP